jgi:nitrile hydratase
MNGVHDMGGMHGFGAIRYEAAYCPFHSTWEQHAYAMTAALMRLGIFNVDELRRAIECIPPAQYLASSYYQRWLTALETLVKEKGVLTAAEIEAAMQRLANRPDPVRSIERRDNPVLVQTVMAFRRPGPSPAIPAGSRFKPGDPVLARNHHPTGHIRLPRYVRGKQGIVHRLHGMSNLPDANAHGQGQHPQPVYSVRFAARDLWGDVAAPKDSVFIDLWESYLEPRRI